MTTNLLTDSPPVRQSVCATKSSGYFPADPSSGCHPMSPEDVLRSLGEDELVQIAALADHGRASVRHSSGTWLSQKSPSDMQKTRRRSPAAAASRSHRYGARRFVFPWCADVDLPLYAAISRIFLRFGVAVVTCGATFSLPSMGLTCDHTIRFRLPAPFGRLPVSLSSRGLVWFP